MFLGHEGVQAEMDFVELNVFRLADHGIPYGFTPVLVANPETLRYCPPLPSAYPLPPMYVNSSPQVFWHFLVITSHPKAAYWCWLCTVQEHVFSCRDHQSSMKAFLRATARGYEAAAADPQRAAALLVEESKGALNPDFAQKSQEYASKVSIFFRRFACDPELLNILRELCLGGWKRCKVSLSLSAMLESQLDSLKNFIARYTMPWKASEVATSCLSCFPAHSALPERVRPMGIYGARAVADLPKVAA